jgi:hypothetical protein
MQEQLNSLEKSMEIIGANAFHTSKSFKLPDNIRCDEDCLCTSLT